MTFDLADRTHFDTCVKVHDAVADGEMPPKKKPRPEAKTATPFSGPSIPAQRLFQGPPAKSKFLAARILDTGGELEFVGGCLKSGDAAQQGRLPAARTSQKEKQLPGSDLKIQPV